MVANASTSEARRGALFVDFENVYYALLKGDPPLRREAALSGSMEAIGEIRKRLRDDGCALVVERSYADWEQLPATAQRQLQVLGVLPRFTDSRPDKSTADIELSLDVLSAILAGQGVEHVAIIGGDRDYLPILRRLKEQNCRITVCSLAACLSGDVREFLKNTANAELVELDQLIDVRRFAPPPPAPERPAAPTSTRTPTAAAIDPHEWHERYLDSMLRFMRDFSYREIHVGPFIRWLQDKRVFELVSGREQRQILDELVNMGAVTIEERDTGQGYAFSVAAINWNHPLVRKLHG